MVLAAIITFIVWIYYLAISLDYIINYYGRDLDSGCYIILAIIVLFAVFGFLCWRKAESVKAKQVLQFMHKDDPEGRRSSEDRHLEEFVMRHERRAASPSQPLIHTGPSPGIPDERPLS
ncbi:uncharacterized protein LOC135224943 [Macrobrachium nipponense]|uniref:uncharacterized protein LOC135224943 n=1 Tax=Macrobrachium nipponense TaxID=159736 RepID=UPI0030C7F052